MATVKKHISKNGKASYYIRVFDGFDEKGKKIEYSMTWKPDDSLPEEAIEAELKKQIAKFEAEILGKSKNCPTFEAYATDWLNSHKPPILSNSTYINYESMLKTINASIGNVILSDLTVWHLQGFYKKLREPDSNRREAYAIAKTLLSVMKERKLSNQKIADMAGVAASTVSAARKVGNHVNIESAKKIAEALGIPLDELFEVHSDTNGLSEKTIQNHHLFISTVLEQAWRDGLVPYNIIGGRRRELK